MPAAADAQPRRPGSQPALRAQNRARIIAQLESGPLTQVELARRTGLSPATISNLVRILADEGTVSLDAAVSSGRRATSVRLAGDTLVAGIDFGRRHARVVLAAPGLHLRGERMVELPRGYPAMEGVQIASDAIDELLVEVGIGRASVAVAGIGIPGPIDSRIGTVVNGSILPEWVGLSATDIRSVLGMPVVLDNDANLGALAEIRWGGHTGVRDLIFVKIGSGIGAGLILDGRLYRGSIGVTGELGHTNASERGAVCSCGNRGCLETVASTSVMLDLLYRGRAADHGVGDIVRRAREGDPATRRVVEDATTAIGAVLGDLANILNPQMIVIGGPLAALGELLVDPIRRSMLRHTMPSIGDAAVVDTSTLGDRAEVLGAAALALDRLSEVALRSE